jgi:hypothetical protein
MYNIGRRVVVLEFWDTRGFGCEGLDVRYTYA